MYNFIQKIRGDENADTIDVYEALDMSLCGMFAYRSILAGNVPVAIPDLRDKAEREKYRNDVKCTDPAVAGDQYIPPYHGGEPDIPDEVYDRARELWLKDLHSDTGYSHAAFHQGESEKK